MVSVMIRTMGLLVSPPVVVVAGGALSILITEPLGIPFAGINILLMALLGWIVVVRSPGFTAASAPSVVVPGSESAFATGNLRAIGLVTGCWSIMSLISPIWTSLFPREAY
jgi:hypothetical protein